MTDFRDSGLPDNPTVFKAFKTYRENMAELPPEVREDQAPLKVARLLGQNTNDNNAVMLALLGLMPQTTWGVVKKRFGDEIAEQLAESRLHVATGYAYLADASPAVKQLTMAGAIVAFGRVEKSAEDMEDAVRTIKLSGAAPMGFSAPTVLMPDTYAKIARAVEGTSGAPQLESLYQSRFDNMKDAQAGMIAQMAEVGIFIQGLHPGLAPAEMRYPAFEDTGLMDTPKIRTAYEALTQHTRVQPEDFEGALSVGKILSTVSPTKNPTAIAAALIDVGIRQMNQYDMHFLSKKLDWDVTEVLNTVSVYTVDRPQTILAASIEFRQLAVANAVSVMDDARKGGEEFLRLLDEHPEYPKGAIMQNMLSLKRISVMSQQIFAPAIGTTDMPELDRLFGEKLKALNAFIEQNMPENKAPAPKPSERKPKKPENDGPKP